VPAPNEREREREREREIVIVGSNKTNKDWYISKDKVDILHIGEFY